MIYCDILNDIYQPTLKPLPNADFRKTIRNKDAIFILQKL